MIVEIKGTGSHNKGAEMMLLTILNQLENEKIIFTIAPKAQSSEYDFFSKLGIFPKLWLTYKGIQFGKLGKFIPKKIRQLYGMITDEEVDIILDASGFAYSSQWGNNPTKVMAKELKRWNKMGKKVILLPQAFGPFENNAIKTYMKTIIENATLIYARDKQSYNELIKIKDDPKIKLSPDFTVLFKGIKPSYFNEEKHQVCIVPNQRMKDKVVTSQSYEDFFVKIIEKIQSKGLIPFFLIHGGVEDKILANNINLLLKHKIEIIDEKDPYLIKGIIENSKALIGSRFHSLASGLYSGIPTLGTGWSHKYQYLFKEFDFEEGLITVDSNDTVLDEKLSYIFNKKKYDKLSIKLLNFKKDLTHKAINLFEEVKQVCGIN